MIVAASPLLLRNLGWKSKSGGRRIYLVKGVKGVYVVYVRNLGWKPKSGGVESSDTFENRLTVKLEDAG